MKQPILFIIAFFAITFFTIACGKEEDERPIIEEVETVVGVYDIIGYSLNDCGAISFNLTESQKCQTVEEIEFCFDGTLEFTAELLKMNLTLTADGEEDGFNEESTYTIMGDQITTCIDPTECETDQFEFADGVVKVTHTDTDGCIGSFSARKR